LSFGSRCVKQASFFLCSCLVSLRGFCSPDTRSSPRSDSSSRCPWFISAQGIFFSQFSFSPFSSLTAGVFLQAADARPRLGRVSRAPSQLSFFFFSRHGEQRPGLSFSVSSSRSRPQRPIRSAAGLVFSILISTVEFLLPCAPFSSDARNRMPSPLLSV
jgi:hypothetical protein